MTYKEFKTWCNERACDGCWNVDTAMFCMYIANQINKQPFWKREKKWQELNTEYSIQNNIVNVINQKITCYT